MLEELSFVVSFCNYIVFPCELGSLKNLLHQTPVPITSIYEDLSLHFHEAHSVPYGCQEIVANTAEVSTQEFFPFF